MQEAIKEFKAEIQKLYTKKVYRRELNRAFAKRQIGDYTHTFAISGDEASQLLEAGRRFVATVKQYFQENPYP